LRERAGKLTTGVAVLKVAALTEPEMKEKKYRIEDAINATQAALEEGVVIGGGMTLYKLSELETDAMYKGALRSVFWKICENAGKEPKEILKHPLFKQSGSWSVGYDALSDQVCDLFFAGVLDPYKVVRTAIENAFSVAMMLLTTGAIIAFKDDPSKSRQF
jgi:chaperonin GroEL